jgi:hypothetical protein
MTRLGRRWTVRRRPLRLGAPLAVLLLLCAVTFSCGRDRVSDEDIARAQAALAPFKQQLQGALREGLGEGPESAIDACRIKAPRIAARLSTDEVALGRTSHRLRNPANAPEPWMKPLLDDYVARRDDRTPRAVRLADDSVGYVEPIYVQPLCLTCHGEDIAPSIAKRLASVYPDDNGRGFAAGDFRGLFWVKLTESP